MKFSIIIFTCLIVSNLSAQKVEMENTKQTLPLSISILDESISVPNFWFLNYSYNPAVIVGSEYVLKQKEKSDRHLTGNIGFYYHKNWELAFFINSEIGYRYHFNRFNVLGRFGLGYLHQFAGKTVYTFQDGTYKEKTDFGSPALLTSLALSCEYEIKKTEYSPAVFLTFMSSAKLPFSIYNGLNQFVGLGYKFYPFIKKEN